MDGDGALSHFASCRTRHVRAKLVRRVHRLCACLHRRQYANGRFLFQALLTFSPGSVALPNVGYDRNNYGFGNKFILPVIPVQMSQNQLWKQIYLIGTKLC